MLPQHRRPHRLPALEGEGNYLSEDDKTVLFAKYGDLSAQVAPRVRSVAAIHEAVAAKRLLPQASTGRHCDRCEHCERNELRVSQLEQRITLLANALRQQDELTQRMSAALEEVMAKTSALPLPRTGAANGLPGMLALAHDGGGGAVDAGGMVVPDPTLGGTGAGALFAGQGMVLQGGGAGGGGAGGGAADGIVVGQAGAGGMGGNDYYDDEEGDEEGDDPLDDDGGDMAAPVGLEALAGMEAVSAEEMASAAGVGEAGTVNVPGRGMKQVTLQLRYREPVVLACIVPTRPGSASPSPQSPPQRGAAGGFAAAAAEKARHATSVSQSVVCVPFKNSTSFTIQLMPPPAADVTVAYLVLEAGPHTLDGGARLIVGETAIAEQETVHVGFDTYVETEEEGGAAFDRLPSLLYTLQGGSAGVVASCEASSEKGFSMTVVPNTAARAGRLGAAGRLSQAPHVRAGAAAASSSAGADATGADAAGADAAGAAAGSTATAPSSAATPAEQEAAVVLQATVRGRRVRRQLGADGTRAGGGGAPSAVVGWAACDAEGGDGVLAGTLAMALGSWRELHFEIDYPEAPLLLFSCVGAGGSLAGVHPRCSRLDDRGCSIAIDDARSANGAAEDGDDGDNTAEDGDSPTTVSVAWLALPAGKLWALAESDEGSDVGGDAHLASAAPSA